MTIYKTNNSVGTQSLSLRENIETNGKQRKIQIIGSGASSLAFGGGVATASLLGGPLVAIIALAVAAFAALGAFVTLLLAKSKANAVKPQEKVEPSVTQQIAEKMAITQPVQTPVAPKQGLLNQALSYAKEHPYRTALGAAALTAGASAGLYALGAFSSGFSGALVPVAATSTALTVGQASVGATPLLLMSTPAFKPFTAPLFRTNALQNGNLLNQTPIFKSIPRPSHRITKAAEAPLAQLAAGANARNSTVTSNGLRSFITRDFCQTGVR